MERKIGKFLVRTTIGMVFLLLILSAFVTPASSVKNVATGQGGDCNWYFTVYDSDGKVINDDIEVDLFLDDYDSVVDDQAGDTTGQFNFSGLKESTQYVLVVRSDQNPPEYLSKVIRITTPASGNATLQKQIYLSDYTEEIGYYWSTAAGLWAVGFIAGGILICAILITQMFGFPKPKRGKKR